VTTNRPGDGELEFRILGPLEVVDGGRPVRLGGRQQRAVRARLLLDANRVVSSGRLVEEVWGDRPPEKAAGTLQVYVFHLRAALEPDRAKGSAGRVLVTRDPGYLLRASSDQVDSARFGLLLARAGSALRAGEPEVAAESASAGLDLWRGPLLADLTDYAFTQAERGRLEELRLVAVEYQLEAELGLGRHVEAAGRLEALVAEHPLRERLHGQLMLALYRAGHQADALAAYRRARKLLADELGLDPSEDLQRLEAAILQHDPGLDWTPPREPGGTAAAVPAMIDSARPVGRLGSAVPAAAVQVTPDPVGPAPVQPTAAPPGPDAADAVALPRRRPGRLRRRTRLLAVLAAAAVAAGTVTAVVARPGHRMALAPGNVVSSLTAGGRVVAQMPVGNNPAAVTTADGTVWVTNTADDTVSRIDPAHARELTRIAGVGRHPSAIAVGDGTA